MKWTLLVPGALVPGSLAAALARAMDAPRLAQALATARQGPAFAPGAACLGAMHWSWLARALALPWDPPVTAPYAWRMTDTEHREALSVPETSVAALNGPWIAHADPVHMVLARDHMMVADLADAPLTPAEAQALLALANEVLVRENGARLALRGDKWFLVSEQPWDLHALPLDAVLGRPAQDCMPTGADARRWRVLSNEIQMLWHTAAVNEAREELGQRPVNALWLHGAGRWQALSRIGATMHRTDRRWSAEPVIDGWLQASASPGGQAQGEAALHTAAAPAKSTLSVYADLFVPRAHQSWEAWLARLPALEERLALDLAAARAAGATEFALGLCGRFSVHTAVVPLQAPPRGLSGLGFWRRSAATPPAAEVLQRWLAEEEAPPTEHTPS
jgi:hypothetical protein